MAKFSGASGNYNALVAAYPEVDWQTICRGFIERRLGLVYNPLTTQIEPHDYIAELSNGFAGANTVLTDFARDMWLYISRGVLKQKVNKLETGSHPLCHTRSIRLILRMLKLILIWQHVTMSGMRPSLRNFDRLCLCPHSIEELLHHTFEGRVMYFECHW